MRLAARDKTRSARTRLAVALAASMLWGAPLSRAVAQPQQTPATIYRENIGRIFTIRAGNELGTGFAFSSARIATNAHVVGAADIVDVEAQGGARYQAKVIARDKDHDVAVLEFVGSIRPFSTVVPLRLGPTPAIGEGVVVIGSPLGSKGTVTTGIVSQIDPTGVIQLNAAVNPGNSGGPVFDMQGRVFGIATAKLRLRSGEVQVDGLAIAIPIAWLQRY